MALHLSIITGKAVAGLPVVGTINIKDSSNPVKTSFSAINSDGSYTLDIDETWTSPFMMWAEGWVNNKHLRLLSCFDLERVKPRSMLTQPRLLRQLSNQPWEKLLLKLCLNQNLFLIRVSLIRYVRQWNKV